ncbi:MAG: hypothetical protein ACE5ID_09950, partial [Acidobacteriota bacterium]
IRPARLDGAGPQVDPNLGFLHTPSWIPAAIETEASSMHGTRQKAGEVRGSMEDSPEGRNHTRPGYKNGMSRTVLSLNPSPIPPEQGDLSGKSLMERNFHEPIPPPDHGTSRANRISTSKRMDETPGSSSFGRGGRVRKSKRVFLQARHLPVLLGAMCLVAISLAGTPYYRLDKAHRFRHPLHSWLKPSGYIGQSAGLVAFALFVFLWLYPLRKRFRWLAFTGKVGRWLDVHVVAGLLIPLLGAVHAGWRFDGLIGLGYVAMLVVSLSGIMGRYIYARIPRRRDGIEISLKELQKAREDLIQKISSVTGLERPTVEAKLAVDPVSLAELGPLATMVRLVRDDVGRWRAARELRRLARDVNPGGARRLSRASLRHGLKLARRQMALSQQVRMLDATHSIFRYWHVAHRPIAVSALVAVTVHVLIVVGIGQTWLW